MEKKTIKVVVESVSCPAQFNGTNNTERVHFFTASDLTTGKTLEHALSFSMAKASSFAGFNAFILEDGQTLLDLTKDSKQRVLTCEVLIVSKGETYTNNKGEQIAFRGFDKKPDNYKLMLIERIKDNAPFARLAKSREDRFIMQETALANFELIKGYPYEAATATPEDIDLFERLVNR